MRTEPGEHIVSAAVSSKWAKGTGGPAGDECQNLVAEPRMDAKERELAPDKADTLSVGANQTTGFIGEAVCFEPRYARNGRGKGDGAPCVAFTANDDGRDARGDCAPTLRAGMNDKSNANSGVHVGVAYAPTAFTVHSANSHAMREGGRAPAAFESERARALDTRGGYNDGQGGTVVAGSTPMVRRLTPRECERLQGFPDDWTLIAGYRRKLAPDEVAEMAEYWGMDAAEAAALGGTPDGPRYRAIGNSMAVPVMAWLGRRIAMVDAAMRRK